MKVSIVTSVFNSASTIGDTLASIASQTHKDIEHIVIDGASTDGTVDILKKWDRHEFTLVSEKDDGALFGMNKGAALATGDIVGFLNADDVFVDENVVQKLVDCFISKNVDCCYADVVYCDAHDLNKVVRRFSMGQYSAGKLRRGWGIAHPAFYVKTNVFNAVGPFDPKYDLQSDFEFTVRYFLNPDYKSIYLPEVFVKMRLGGISNGSFSNIVRQNLLNVEALREHGVHVNYTYIAWRWLWRSLQYFDRSSG